MQVSDEYLLTHFSTAREPIPLGKMLGDHFIVLFNQGSDAFLQILDGSMLSLGVVTQGQKALFIITNPNECHDVSVLGQRTGLLSFLKHVPVRITRKRDRAVLQPLARETQLSGPRHQPRVYGSITAPGDK